jgi:hypothetical protein
VDGHYSYNDDDSGRLIDFIYYSLCNMASSHVESLQFYLF